MENKIEFDIEIEEDADGKEMAFSNINNLKDFNIEERFMVIETATHMLLKLHQSEAYKNVDDIKKKNLDITLTTMLDLTDELSKMIIEQRNSLDDLLGDLK